MLLQEFQFEVEHVPGSRNELPDFLSRNPENDPEAAEDVDESIERLAVPKAIDKPQEVIDYAVLNVIPNPFEIIEQQQRNANGIRELKARWQLLGLNGPQTQAEEDFFAAYTLDEEKDIFYKVESV